MRPRRARIEDGSRRGSLALAFAALAAAAAFAGCAFFLDASSNLGDHCTIDGEDELCGSCLGLHCQAQLDACCGDAECQADLDLLDDCADGDDEACLTYPLTTPLGACLVVSCAADCFEEVTGPGGGGIGGQTGGLVSACATGDLSCFCEMVEDTGQAPTFCSSSDFEHGECCAEPGYPAEAGAGCGCVIVNCIDYGSSCECGYFDAGVGDRNSICPSFDYEYCCRDPNEPSCECRNRPCESHEEVLSGCYASDVGCATGLVDDYSCDI